MNKDAFARIDRTSDCYFAFTHFYLSTVSVSPART